MQLRRFVGENTPATLGAVRLAFGAEAIILANRRLGDQVEIIATGQLDDTELSTAKSVVNDQILATPNSMPISDAFIAGDSTPVDDVPIDVVESSAAAVVSASLANSQNSLAGKVDTPTPVSDSVVFGKPDTAPKYTPEPRADAVDATPLEAGTDLASSGDLRSHIDESFEQLEQRFRCLEVNLWGSRNAPRSLLLRQLLGIGLGAELAVRLAERVPPGKNADDALRHALSLLKATLPIGIDRCLSESGVTVLSGPAGSGKSTVLMKIATQHVKCSGNQSLVIICADNRRIGAFESMQVFGRLLGVPVVQAHNAQELTNLLDALSHKELVLVDQSLDDSTHLEPLSATEDASDTDVMRPAIRRLLVLSAGLQAATVESVLGSLPVPHQWKCALTHLDDCSRLGELFGALIRHHVPIVSWSDTASVQTPLHRADASVLVATAVAMGKRIRKTPDDDWLMALIQPVGASAQQVSVMELPSAPEVPPC